MVPDLPVCDDEFEPNPDVQHISFLTKDAAAFAAFLRRFVAEGWSTGAIYGWNQV
jgi:hypothetical protein